MPFRAEMNYTRQDMRQFETMHQKFRYKGMYYASKALLVLALAAFAVCLAFFAAAFLMHFEIKRDLLLRFLLLVFAICLWLVLKRIQRTAAWKSINAHGTIRLTAEEDRIHVEAGSLRTDSGYDAYCDLVHYRDCYYLYIDKRKAQIVPERCFTEGDPAAFGAFFSEKTGLEWNEIK